MSTNVFNPSDRRDYPDRWPRHRGKELFTEVDSRCSSENEELLSVSHITGITPRSQKNVTMFQSESLVGYKICEEGDIVANTMWTWQGAIGVSQYHGVVSPAYNVYRQKNNAFNPIFLDLLLREPKLVDVYHSISTGIRSSRLRLYPDEFLTIDFPVPPREEQDQIVRFLDWKISSINRLIKNKEKQIHALEEMKKVRIADSIFTQSRKEDKKKRLLPVKRVFNVFSGATPKSDNPKYWDGDIIWITPADYGFEDHYITSGTRNITEKGFCSCSTSLIPEGSIIISKRAPVGTVAINKVPLCTSQGCLSCVPKENICVEFYYYLFSAVKDELESLASGTTFKEISYLTFSNYLIPVPSLNSQKEIAESLNCICNNISVQEEIIRAQISNLHELRNKMISDVVTGKIDVRNVVIPEYEYTPEEGSADGVDDEELEEEENDNV